MPVIRTVIPSCMKPYGATNLRWFSYWWTLEQTPTPAMQIVARF
jgi:hypothetical protein